MDAIIPVAPQRSATSEMSPIADSGVRDLLDGPLDVPLPRGRDGQDLDQLVDDLLSERVVLQHEPEDGHERDRQGKSENSTR